MTDKVINIEANLQHTISEVVCLKCLERWVAVYPSRANILKKFECPNGHVGYVIKTGQEIKE